MYIYIYGTPPPKPRFGLKTLVFTVFSDKKPESARTLSCQAVFQFSRKLSGNSLAIPQYNSDKKLSAKLNKLQKPEKKLKKGKTKN